MDNKIPPQSEDLDSAHDDMQKHENISSTNQLAQNKTTADKWKFIVVAILGLILVIGIVFLQLNQNQNQNQVPSVPNAMTEEETSSNSEVPLSWNTYTNTKHQYSIDYPTSWNKTESPSGDGVSFNPQNSVKTEGMTDEITVYVGQKTMTENELTFEEYVKVAAIQEIQNYNKLASVEPIALSNGSVGYKTTWMVQSIVNNGSGESESAPITYFQIPGKPNSLLRVNSGFDTDQSIYDYMIESVLISTPPETITNSVSPDAMQDDEIKLEDVIKEQILADSESDGSALKVSVSQVSGDYAKGMASDDGGGGLWFAAKVNGEWELVWDGNGIIFCSDLTGYPNFPASMISECYDQKTDQLIMR